MQLNQYILKSIKLYNNLLFYFEISHIIYFNSELLQLKFSYYQKIKLNIKFKYNKQAKMISQIQIKSIDHYQIRRNEVLNVYPSSLGLSDSAIYCYLKQASFFTKKQERAKLYFFQGLNANPQNLSIFLMDQVGREASFSTSKQKLVKGVFNIYDIFTKSDCIVEINIPGTLKIFKMANNKKQTISNQQINFMYISSVLRSLYQKNLIWGRYYELFKEGKSQLLEFQNFIKIFLKVIIKRDIFISEQFQATAQIKGSNSLSLLLRYVIDKKITSHCLECLKRQMNSNPEYLKSPKLNIFMAQLYSEEGKFSKSIQYTCLMAKQYSNDPYILYYKAKYLHSLLMMAQAVQVLHLIVQYNQFQIWILLSKIHIQNKNFIDGLICLNHAAKLTKCKHLKSIDTFWKIFDDLGKIKLVTGSDPIYCHPRINIKSQNPLNIPVKLVEQKYKPILQHPSWRLNTKQKEVYKCLQSIFYRMDQKKAYQLLQQTFYESKNSVNQVTFKKGLTESMFVQNVELNTKDQLQDFTMLSIQKQKIQSQTDLNDQLPHFLQEQEQRNEPTIQQVNRNLSIIPQIESLIQNSTYEQKERVINTGRKGKVNFQKRQMSEILMRILKLTLSDDQFQKNIFHNNYIKMLPIYNKLRASTIHNNYYTVQMFKIFAETGNYNSIIILTADLLDFLQGKGIRKVRKLPYWLQTWVFYIINQKGLTFLNSTLNKLVYIDQAILDTINLAQKWHIAGINY